MSRGSSKTQPDPTGFPAVSFVKPIRAAHEHPGHTSDTNGSSHLVDLLKAIENGPNAKNTMVIVTYDEFGGQWDHASPPGSAANPGPHDAFGPGTRVPTLIISLDFGLGIIPPIFRSGVTTRRMTPPPSWPPSNTDSDCHH